MCMRGNFVAGWISQEEIVAGRPLIEFKARNTLAEVGVFLCLFIHPPVRQFSGLNFRFAGHDSPRLRSRYPRRPSANIITMPMPMNLQSAPLVTQQPEPRSKFSAYIPRS